MVASQDFKMNAAVKLIEIKRLKHLRLSSRLAPKE
jgi:hypothetical protein